MYGNYCGPYWSAGQHQASVVSDVEPIDAFDSTCKDHDESYALGDDLVTADLVFAAKNIGRGPLRTAAGVAVGAQGIGRAIYGGLSSIFGSSPTTFPGQVSYPIDTPTPQLNGVSDNLPLSMKNKNNKTNKTVTRATQVAATEMRETPRVTPAPVALGTRVPSMAPKYTTRNGNVVVTNREYVGYLSGSSSFNLVSYPANPGISSLFPWLSNIANNYDRYRVKRLRFIFVSSVSTATAGRIALVWNYNAADLVPSTKLGALSIHPAEESNVWESFALDIPTTGGVYYTRDGLPVSIDLKTTDMGSLYVVTDLCSGSSTIGELYAEYEFEFMNPHASIPPFSELWTVSASITDCFPAGTPLVGADLLGDSTVANCFRINATGRYLFNFTLVGTGTPLVSAAACQDSGTISTITSLASVTNSGATASSQSVVWGITVDPSQQYTTIKLSFTGTTLTKFYMMICRIDGGISPVFTVS